MRSRYPKSLSGAAVVLAVLVAAPAIGAMAGSDPSGQPPPGAESVVPTDHFAPVPEQPPAGASAQEVTEVAPVPEQPVNLHPKQSTGFQAGLEIRQSKDDQGVKGATPTRDRGVKNAPVSRD